jgi:translation initiation factor 2B subunit (eIF-2B alpha/beta/delta family)
MLPVQLKATSSGSNKQVIRILTLGNSASVYTAIMALLVHLPTAHVHLTILEYRPRFDGAELATNLLTEVYSASEDLRLHVCVVPDCAMASIVTATNVLLLSADYIAANGNVCSKMGSLAAAICVKKLQPNSKVVIIGDGDKIGPMRPGELSTECHSVDVITKGWSRCTKEALQIVKDKIEIFTDSQEWVPKDLIDVYVTDSGLMDAEQLASYVEDISNLETALFG